MLKRWVSFESPVFLFSFAAMIWLSILTTNSFLAVCVWLPLWFFLSIFHYSKQHDFFHKNRSSTWLDCVALLHCALVGTSWTLYKRHHANHHQYNNLQGDYAKTTDDHDRPIPGWRYLASKALLPFAVQLVPIVWVLLMKRKKRSTQVWLEEAVRLAIRIATFAVFGVKWFCWLLFLQLMYLASIMWLNYLQHFGVTDGRGVVWTHPGYNYIFNDLGYHDQHHQKPSLPPSAARKISARQAPIERMGLFSPIAFALFLFSPDRLQTYLGSVNN